MFSLVQFNSFTYLTIDVKNSYPPTDSHTIEIPIQ